MALENRTSNRWLVLATALVLLVLAGSQTNAQEPKLIARPLTHQEIIDLGLPETVQVSPGLFTVGVGAPVYLEVLVLKEAEVGAVNWTLASKPGGSNAALRPSLLGPNIPIYGPGDREVYKIASRQLLVPDVKGPYMVNAMAGEISLSATITAATYVGVGTVGGATPAFPQCALCHADVAEKWAGTGHATFFKEAIDGEKSSHYNQACIECHTTGFDPAPTAVNNGFDDVAARVGWTFPEELKEGNWLGIAPELKAVSNIQCESCHGPGSEHGGRPGTISVSLDAGDCGQCHDEQPYHNRNIEWSQSRHAVATRYPTGENRQACVVCHSGIGFIERIDKGLDITQADYASQVTVTEYQAITCQVCHDPHDATNPHQLRRVDEVTLMNGVVVTEGGTGKLCMDCHKARRNGPEYAEVYHSRHNPHESPQADMLVGTNAVEYGREIRNSTHVYAVEDACATCHMQAVGRDDPAWTHAGGHTFRPVFDNGTPDNPDDDVAMTAACVNCHGPMNSFDLPREDFDGDGVVEGVQTEVHGLVEILAMALPPIGESTVSVTEDYTVSQLKAAYNYAFVEADGSMGIHNTRYAVGILKASIQDLTGRNIVTSVATEAVETVPAAYALAQNFPNPFNPETQIHYAVPEPGQVRIDIYNTLGQKVRSLVEAYHTAGEYRVKWDGRDNSGHKLTAGVYIYAMQAGEFMDSRKMVLVE